MKTTETSMNLAPEPLTVSHGIVKIVRKSLKEEHAHASSALLSCAMLFFAKRLHIVPTHDALYG